MLFRFARTASGWMPAFLDGLVRSGARAGSPDALRWQQKVRRQKVTIARLHAALEQAEARSRDLHARLEARRQAGLSHAVLRRLLPVRAAHPPLAACDAPGAAARHEAMTRASGEYAAAMAQARPADLQAVEIDGLRWWVPTAGAGEGRLDRVRRQGFPYRAILQTREVAIGGFMIDIGANIGRTSIPRVLLGDVRGVYAAEPEPANYACLIGNVLEHGLRGYVLPDRVAIGASRGEARLRRSKYPGGHRIAPDECRGETVCVPMWPLDEWVGHLGIELDAVTFVKVDTQGCELAVLRGASALLARRHIAWLIEIDPDLLRRAGTDVRDLLALLQRHFTSYIDIGSPDPGRRVRPTADLAESCAYLGARQTKTDLLLFHA